MALAVSLLLLAACGGDVPSGTVRTDSAGIEIARNGPVPAVDPDRIRVRTELTIQSNQGGGQVLQRVTDVAPVRNGRRILVLDQMARSVRVYDADGQFLRQIGGPGEGPGELSRSATRVLVLDRSRIAVPDLMNARVQFFHLSGRLLEAYPLKLEGRLPVAWGVTPEDRVALAVRRIPFRSDRRAGDRMAVVRLARSADTPEDTVLLLETGEMLNPLPNKVKIFAAEPVWQFFGDGGMVTGRGDRFELEVRARDGSVERLIRKPYRRRVIEDRDQQILLELMSANLEAAGIGQDVLNRMDSQVEFAEHYPAFTQILTDGEGRIWVQRGADAEELRQRSVSYFTARFLGASTWDVFGRNGRYLARVDLPVDFRLTRVRGDQLYGYTASETSGPIVKRLSVAFPPERTDLP